MTATAAYPIAYIRRSVSRTGDRGDVSRDYQTEEVRRLANGDRDALRIIDGDWGRSGGRKSAHLRAAFDALVADVEAGKVSVLYAYSEDRLARDVEASVRLLNACERAGVTIVTRADRYAPGDPRARRRFIDEANDNEYALSKMVEKASDTATKRKERGDAMGRAPYGYRHAMVDGRSILVPREGEDPQHVVDAFALAGTFLEAAKALNAEDYPTRFAGKRWDPSTVRNVVKRTAPELVPLRTRRGASTRATRLFAGLLRCPHWERHPDTPTLTTQPSKWGVRYYCLRAHHDPQHARPYIVAESKILAWAKVEIARLGKDLHHTLADVRAGAAASAADLDARRERIIQNFEDGDIDRDQKRAKLAAIDAELEALEGPRRVKSFTLRGRVDWSGDPASVNAELRNVWTAIELGPDMLPVRPVWTPGMGPDR